jgi:hypothetical protein
MAESQTASRRRLRPLFIAAAVIVALVVAAWALQAALTGGADGSSGAPDATAYTVKVERNGKLLKQYDLADLHALPQTRVVIAGKPQTGPSLKTLLADAGAASYHSVDVRGAGLRDSGHLTLSAHQVDQQVQIDFADRGTAKVCGPELYHAQWVRDVLSIDAH